MRSLGALSVVLVALVARLLAMSSHWTDYDIRKTYDQLEYFVLAQNLKMHDTLSYGAPRRWIDQASLEAPGPFEPTAARPPLYPAVIAALWWGDEPPVQEVRLAQVVLGTLAALMAYLIALQAFGFGAAMLAGMATALGPLTLHLTALLYSETLFTFLFTASLWFWTQKRGILAGLLLGAAALTRSVCLPLIGIALVLALLTKFNRAVHLKLALAALLLVVPWTVRNAMTQHAFIPIANVGWGANMLIGTIDVPYGSGNDWITLGQDKEFIGIIQSAPTADEAERRMSTLAAERIRAAPLHWFWVRLKQYPRFWLGTGDMISMQPVVKYGYILGAVLFWGLAVIGLFLARRRWRELYPLALFPVLLAGAHFLGSAEERYSLGLVPVAAVFAGSAVIRMLRPRSL